VTEQTLGLIITGGLTFAGVVVTVIVGPRLKDKQERDRQSKAEHEARQNYNSDEARKLRDEVWRVKLESDERADDLERELERWRSAYYALRDSVSRVLGRCESGVRVALSFLKGTQYDPAKEELSKLDEELKAYNLPETPQRREQQK
jgi:hypothetical protein